MKKLLLLVSTLILAACGGGDVIDDITDRMDENSDYLITVDYTEFGETKQKYEYTHISSEKAFDVKGTIVKDDGTYTITYKTFKKDNTIENLKVVDQNGEEYETNDGDHDAYMSIMLDISTDRLFMSDLDSSVYTNISASETETTYDYIITDTETDNQQKDTYKFYKDLSGYTAIIENEDDKMATTTFKFL